MVRDYSNVSEETRKKISLSKLGIKRPDVSARFKGVPKTEEHKKKLSSALKGSKSPNWGKRFSKETLKKMSKAQKGRTISLEGRINMSKSQLGSKGSRWKGGVDTYRAIHNWVNKWAIKSNTCEDCGESGLFGRKIHWANISGKYKRDLKDWKRLCIKCHKKFDKENRTHEQ